jgi:hypothetical protein
LRWKPRFARAAAQGSNALKVPDTFSVCHVLGEFCKHFLRSAGRSELVEKLANAGGYRRRLRRASQFANRCPNSLKRGRLHPGREYKGDILLCRLTIGVIGG